MGNADDYIDIWRVFNVINILNPYLFYIFSQQLSGKFYKSRSIVFGCFGIALIFLNYYKNTLIPDLILEMTWHELFLNIWPYNFLVLYSSILFLLSSFGLYKNYTSKSALMKKLLILWALLTTFGDMFSYGTVYSETLYNLPYFDVSFIFPFIITYLVLKHRLFDARSMLLHMFRWIFIGGIGGIIGFGLYWGLLQYGLIGHFEIALLLVDLIPIVIIIFLARSHHVRSYFQLSDVVRLEHDAYDFTTSSAVYKSGEEFVEDIQKTLQWWLKIKSIHIISSEDFWKYPALVKALAYEPKKVKILTCKEAKIDEENGKKNPYAQELRQLWEMCIPIYIEKKLGYLLILPEKNSEAPYTEQEKKIIITLRPKIALSLQILAYNKSLRDEVERQTTQINQQKKELEESYKKLEALDHEKDIFMNMAAHELRTPMTIIRWYADILLDGGSGVLNVQQKKLVENMYKGSESLIALVNDILDLSRIDAGKMEIHYETCNIDDLVQSTFESFGTLMSKKYMQFSLENTLDKNYELVTDTPKLTLVFNNILSNAYKYTPDSGTVLWKIKTIIEGGEPWLFFSVTDSGVGIPPDEIGHVFDRFASISTHNAITSTIQSTGLGLSIVKKIVTGLGGKINVESTVWQWSTFSIHIPYKPNQRK